MFNHNDGSIVTLLNASGYLHICNSTPSIHLTIWVHENYPLMPPVVLITSNANRIHQSHPFVDPCGLITAPYLLTWSHPRCSLCGLVNNLVKIFSIDHPLSSNICACDKGCTHPSLVSKMEALDRLWGMVHYDIIALEAKSEQDIEGLSVLQMEMKKRNDVTTNIIAQLKHERMELKRRVKGLKGEAEVVINWLNENEVESISDDDREDDAYEAADEESDVVINGSAAERAIEDVIYELDKALEHGVVYIDMYIKEVRKLSREQFHYRDMVFKLRGSDALTFL